MAVSQDLLDFVKEGLGRGMSRDEIAAVLGRAGWHPTQVDVALRAFAEVSSPVPVPRPRPYTSAAEAFTYVVLFVTLYASAYSLGALVFDFIDTAIPDAASRRTPEHIRESMRWAISWLVVVFPVFLYVAARTAKATRLDPTRRASPIRRQLTYLTLFIASSALIGDVTTLVYYALGGDLTLPFVLKVLTIGAIGGASLAYWLWDVRAADREQVS